MKNIFLLSLLLLTASCGTQKIISYEYSIGTRGYQKTTIITKKSTSITEKSAEQSSVSFSKTKSALWKSLQMNSDSIKLDSVAYLKAPTNRRDFDAAMFAKVIFTTKDSVYKSASFDGGKPPLMLKTVADSLANVNTKF